MDIIGIVLSACGIAILLQSIVEFARRGRGTLSPLDPARQLVVTGMYRWVRNSMYVGVILVLDSTVPTMGANVLKGIAALKTHGHRLMMSSGVALPVLMLLLSSCRDTTGVDRDGSQLVFIRGFSYDTLFVADPNNGMIRQRVPLLFPATRIAVSPEGDRLAIVHQRELWVMNLDGSSAVLLATRVGNVSWSPDGRRLAYNLQVAPQQLRLVNVDGSGDTIVPGATPGGYEGLAWSPDGRRIAFEGMARDSQGSWRTVYVTNVDGTGLWDVAQDLSGDLPICGEPTWSPDGKFLAISRLEIDGQTNLWIVTLATARGQRITTTGARDERPSWSPGGEWIAFLRFEGVGNSDVFVVRPDGSDLRQITFTPNDKEEMPGWLRE